MGLQQFGLVDLRKYIMAKVFWKESMGLCQFFFPGEEGEILEDIKSQLHSLLLIIHNIEQIDF